MPTRDDQGAPDNEGARQPSLITFAMERVKGPAGARARELITTHDHHLLLKMCYLWPLTCCGVFLPLLVYVRFRSDDQLGLHARHGLVFSAFYTVFMLLMGLVNGLVGRFAESWVSVSVFCALVVLAVVGVLSGLGWRWCARALEGEGVEIPLVTSLALRI